MISGELQYFAFSNPIQVVTVAKRKTRPTCRMDQNPDYYPGELNSSPRDALSMGLRFQPGLEMGLLRSGNGRDCHSLEGLG